MKPRCLVVLDEENFPNLFGPEELARLHACVEWDGRVLNAALVRATVADHDATDVILGSWGMPRLDADLLRQLPRLRAVFYAAGTIKSTITDAAWARGIRVTTAAAENARPTAEFAFAEIVLSLKRAWSAFFHYRDQRGVPPRDPLTAGCYGSTVGLLALGHVGRLVAQRLQSLDVRVVAYDPFATPADAAELRLTLVSLPELFATADVVSCHLPRTPQTHELVNGPLLASMKTGATFINTSRGSVVHEPALIDTLRRRPDLFAVLDVTQEEPLPPRHPLFDLPNVALTPHIAGSLAQECRRMGRMMIDELERYRRGEPLLGEVARDQLEILA